MHIKNSQTILFIIVCILNCFLIYKSDDKLSKLNVNKYEYEVIDKKVNNNQYELLLYNKEYNSYKVYNTLDENLYNLKTIIIDVKQYEIEGIPFLQVLKDAGWFFNLCLILSFVLGYCVSLTLLIDTGEFLILNIINIIFTIVSICICLN